MAADFYFHDGVLRTIAAVGTTATCPAAVTAPNNIAVGVDTAARTVTFLACSGYTASAAGALVNIRYGTAVGVGATNRVTNPTTAATNVLIRIREVLTDGTTIGNSCSVAVAILTEDRVVVTAIVDPTFSFAIGATTCSLGTLSTAAVSSCSYTVTTTTNARGGYVTTIVEDGDLRDGLHTIDDVLDGAVTAGFEEYGIGLTGADREFPDHRRIIDTPTVIARDTTGPIAAQVVTVTHMASISAHTVAGHYSHTVTLISTGTF